MAVKTGSVTEETASPVETKKKRVAVRKEHGINHFPRRHPSGLLPPMGPTL